MNETLREMNLVHFREIAQDVAQLLERGDRLVDNEAKELVKGLRGLRRLLEYIETEATVGDDDEEEDG